MRKCDAKISRDGGTRIEITRAERATKNEGLLHIRSGKKCSQLYFSHYQRYNLHSTGIGTDGQAGLLNENAHVKKVGGSS